MEHFALQALLWLGKIILGQVGGGAVKVVWRRLYPYLKSLVESAAFWRGKAEGYKEEADKVEAATEQVPDLLNEAAEKIAALEEENAQLKQRLSKHEPVDPPPPGP